MGTVLPLIYRNKEKENQKTNKKMEAGNMKKVFAMILCVSMMATALVGCGGGAAEAPAEEAATTEGGERLRDKGLMCRVLS